MLKACRGNGELSGAIITLARRNDHLWNVTRLQQLSSSVAMQRIAYIVQYILGIERAYTIAGYCLYPTETVSRFATLYRVFFLSYPHPDNVDVTLIVRRSMGNV